MNKQPNEDVLLTFMGIPANLFNQGDIYYDPKTDCIYQLNGKCLYRWSKVLQRWILDIHNIRLEYLKPIDDLIDLRPVGVITNKCYVVGDIITLACEARNGVYEVSHVSGDGQYYRLVRLHNKTLRTFVKLWRIAGLATPEQIEKELQIQ